MSLARTVTVVMIASLMGCARPVGPLPPPTPPPKTLAAKYFAVTKERKFLGGCRIFIAPDQNEAEIRVQRGSTVAWVLGNNCDSARDMTLTFYVKGKGKSPAAVAKPITFQEIAGGVLVGTVENVGTGEITYEYTVTVGSHRKDPDIIVF